MKTSFFVISIVLNILLIILLFFKSALNDILKEWWIDKRKVAKEAKGRLINLRANLLKLLTLSPLLLIQTAVHINEKDPIAKKQLKFQWDNTLKAWELANETITKDEILFPSDIRIPLKEFQEKMGNATTEIFKKPMYKERLLEITQEISSSISKIIVKVDYYLS